MDLVCYRIVKSPTPGPDAFASQAEQGKRPPRNLPPEKLAVWDGVSVLETMEQARAFQQELPHLGSYIAELRIPESVQVRRTAANDEGHFNIREKAAVLFPFLGPVTPV